jgi:hypothetical protein
MRQYFKNCKNVTLHNLGFVGNSRVYIFHNLTSTRYKIYKHALQLKKSSKLSSVSITGIGQVAIKINSSSGFTDVNSISQLDQLIHSSEESLALNNSGSSPEFDDAQENAIN